VLLSYGTKVVYMVYKGLTNKHHVVLEPSLSPMTWDLKIEEPVKQQQQHSES